MNPIDPNAPLAITLTAQEWNQVLALLGEGPWRVVNPLINKIGEQAQSAAAKTALPAAGMQLNGADPQPQQPQQAPAPAPAL